MKKKYKRALAAALAAVMIWNTCDWHPQVLAGSSVQYIEEVKELSDEILHQEVLYGTKYKDLELPDKLKVRVLAEEASDEEDGAEDKDGAEKIATPSELQSGDGKVETEKKSQTLSSSETDGTVRKASPSEADGTEKSEIGGVDDTEQKASPSDAEGTKTDKSWKEVKVRWVLDETFSEKDTYDGETPGIYVFDAELRSSRYELDTGFLPSIEVMVLPEEKGPAIIGFSELDETVAVQKLPLGAKESDIILPDTLEVEVEEADETLAEDSQNVHLVEAVDKGTEKDTEAETAVWQISGITWKLDEEQSDLPEFHGGISEKDYFEEFDENGEPVETSTKTWAGYAEANQDYNGCAYVYTPVLPEKYSLGEEAELPEICVLVGEMQLMTLAGEVYNLNEPLTINSSNVNQLNGKTITGSYCPSTRPGDYLDIKGGITIDNVTVDLTIKNVTIKSGGDGARGWDLAGIYLKGNAKLNLTLEGTNTLLGLDEGAGIEVEKGATLVITDQSNGSLKAVGGAYGAAGIGGKAGSTGYEGKELETGTIIIEGGTIEAEGGTYWVSHSLDHNGGAGIGTGLYGIGGTIKILGGTITAKGGEETGAGIGGGAGGSVDTIVIGGANGEAPDITVSSYYSARGYMGAAIGSGWNGVSDLQLSCGDIQILSGSVTVKGGNIGYGVLTVVGGNSMEGGSITISEEVQLELPLESKIAPRGECTYGKKTFRITAYDNQLLDGTYQADISLYRENDTEKASPVYQTKAEMTVSGFRGTISDITQWMGYFGNMKMVVALKPSGGGTVKTMDGTVVLNKGIDETISVTLGETAYQKTMDLTIHDGRLRYGKKYTLTAQIGKEASEGGTASDVVTYSSQKASGYQIKTDKVSWYTPLSGEVPVSVQVQEEGGEGENNRFTVTGSLTMKSEEETNLSLTIGESLYPVRFHFYSSKVQAAANVSLTAGRLAGAASEAPVELKQDKGQFAFDGKLTIDAEAGNHAYALAYLPAGNYRFVINTGIAELGGTGGSFTMDSETVEAKDAGTDIIVLNAAETLEGELDLSLGDISFSEENGQLTIIYSKRDDSDQVVTAKLIDQSYDNCYRIISSGNVEKYHLFVDTSASEELKLVLKNLTITPAEAIAPIQINGESHVTTYLEGKNKISINKTRSNVSPAGISVAKDAKLTIDSEPEQQGSIEVLNNTSVRKTGAAIGGNGGEDAGTIHIKGGTVTAKMTNSSPRGAAIGASEGKSVKEIRISGGVVTAIGIWGAGIGTGGASGEIRTSKIVIEGGTVNASSWSGAGIGSGYGYARTKPAITAEIKIHGGMITAYSEQGACIGSGRDSSSRVLIDGGTICLDKKTTGYRDVAHIGMGQSDNTQVQTDVTIVGGTICLIGADAYIPRPIIYGWEQVDGKWQKNNTTKDRKGNSVYYTTADLTGIYENNTLVEKAGIEGEGSSYGFQDVRTDSNGKIYMYLPASEAVKASFGGVEFTGTVKADTAENVLERELTSIDYGKELLRNNLQSAVEFAQSENASSWTEIPVNGAASLTEILDNQPEGKKEISLYVRKKADTSGAVGTATEIKIPARPETPDPITDVTKGSYYIKVAGTAVDGCEYGISESVDGKLQWQLEKTFTSPTPAHTYYVTLRVKATDSSFASKPADRLKVTTPDALLIDGPAGAVSFEAKGTYGQTLAQIQVRLAEKFKVVNYGRTEVSGNWHFIERQGGMSASSIYPEVKGTTAYQVEFIPDKASEGQYGEPLTQSVTPEISPKELKAVLKTPIVKNYDGSTDIALEATVEIKTPGQSTGHSYTIRDLKGIFEDANAGTDKTVTIDSSEAKVETGESGVNLQNYRIIYPPQTGTIRPIQGSVSIDPQAWTGEKNYGDDSFPLTGVNVVGDGARNYTSSNEKVLTVDAQGQVTIKGPGSADVSITMENGRNYLGTNTPAERTITIEKGTLALTLTAVNRTTGAQLSKGILGTEEEDFDIIARVQGVYQDKLQGYVRFYDNENPDAVIVPVGEDGTAVLKWTKPGESLVGTHTIKAEFDFGEFNTWESRYNTPTPASLTFEISKAAPPAEDKPDNSDKPDQSGSQSSSSGRDKSSGSGATRQDPVKGRINSSIGILTGTANSTANDGKSHWMQDEHGWWLRFADSSYPKAEKRGTNGIAYAWEQVNGNWWAFDESGYIKTGWMRDEDYGGWFYLDPEHGMQTGWVLIDGKWHYFHPTSDGRKGILYVGRLTPDGYYVDENGVWDGETKPTQEGNT